MKKQCMYQKSSNEQGIHVSTEKLPMLLTHSTIAPAKYSEGHSQIE